MKTSTQKKMAQANRPQFRLPFQRPAKAALRPTTQGSREGVYFSLLQTVSAAFLKGPTIEAQRVMATNHLGRMRSFEYGYRRGDAGRPLVVLIPGFGRPYYERTSLYLSHWLQLQGYHVAAMHSPSNPKFLIESHHYGAPGVTTEDGRDLLVGLRAIRDQLREKGARFGEVHLVGYSMGALNAAFVRHLDHQHENLITRLVLINPPIDMNYGIKGLDSFLAAADMPPQQKAKLALKASVSILAPNQVTDRSRMKIQAFLSQPVFEESELRAMIGFSFQETVQGGIRAAQQTFGLKDTRHIRSFTNFCDTVTVRHYNSWVPEADSQILFQNESLLKIGADLATDKNVFLLHNQDDFLLRLQDTQWMKSTFGERAILFAQGGHLGNLWKSEFHEGLRNALDDSEHSTSRRAQRATQSHYL